MILFLFLILIPYSLCQSFGSLSEGLVTVFVDTDFDFYMEVFVDTDFIRQFSLVYCIFDVVHDMEADLTFVWLEYTFEYIFVLTFFILLCRFLYW